MKKILIVEDDEIIRRELVQILSESGYEPCALKKFENVKDDILKSGADLVLLDINLPYMNGETILSELRCESNVPVIMVTSKNSEIDEVLSISYGADDYITKPYNPTLLILRIGAIFKRMKDPNNITTYKGITVNMQRGLLLKDDREIFLTKSEMLIFSYLLSNQNKLVTRDELMTLLWNNNEYINDNALTVNISRLRSKLKEAGEDTAIETRKGYGYILL